MSFIKFNNKFVRLDGKLAQLPELPKSYTWTYKMPPADWGHWAFLSEEDRENGIYRPFITGGTNTSAGMWTVETQSETQCEVSLYVTRKVNAASVIVSLLEEETSQQVEKVLIYSALNRTDDEYPLRLTSTVTIPAGNHRMQLMSMGTAIIMGTYEFTISDPVVVD